MPKVDTGEDWGEEIAYPSVGRCCLNLNGRWLTHNMWLSSNTQGFTVEIKKCNVLLFWMVGG